jgi:hypothetical protein
MSGDILLRAEFHEPVASHRTLAEYVWPWVKEQTTQGRGLVAEFRSIEDARSIQQHRYYWGVVLEDVAEQVVVAGQRYTKDAWHEYGKRQFLPRKTKKVKVAGRARPVVTTVIASTTDLSVRQMGDYLEKWMAFAAENGVTVREPLPPELRPQRRTRKKETIDMETGEVLSA